MNPGGVVRHLGERNFEEPSQSFVNICLKLKKENLDWSENQVFEAALETYQPPYSVSRANTGERFQDAEEEEASKRHGRKHPTVSAQSLLSLFKEAKEQQEQKESAAGSKTDDNDKV